MTEKNLIWKEDLLEAVLGHFGMDLAYFGRDLQFCQEAIDFAPAVAAIPVDVIKSYLLGLIEEWNGLGDRKYELPNMQVYNHIRKELDDLEEYTLKHFPNGDCK